MLRFLATDIPLGEQSVLNHELNEAKLYSRSESSFEISAGVPFFTKLEDEVVRHPPVTGERLSQIAFLVSLALNSTLV